MIAVQLFSAVRRQFGSIPQCSPSVQENYFIDLLRELAPKPRSLKRSISGPTSDDVQVIGGRSSQLCIQKVKKQESQSIMTIPAVKRLQSSEQNMLPLNLQCGNFPTTQDSGFPFAESRVPTDFQSETVNNFIPISSVIDISQPVQDSISLLRQWFRNLNVNSLTPVIPPSGNLAAYVPRSYTLSQLVRLGVDLSRLEAIPGAANFLVKLDFHKSVEPVLWKFHHHGFCAAQIARVCTAFPKMFQLPLSEIDSRINYFIQHGFITSTIPEMFCRCPAILASTSVDVDRQLGNIQVLFQLTADDLRACITSVPKAIIHPLGKIKDVYVVLTKMMGFPNPVARSLVCSAPKLLVTERERLATNFVFMHSRLNLPLESIQMWPSVLSSAPHLLSQRATFLIRHGLLQTDPTRPLYTPLDKVVEGTDAHFCKAFGRVEESQFNIFLKTL
ncbi:hypothetical protein EG68_09097 [Paragonimus skrjabini miyazakii]|uniref:Uncharacterized protein n=1 Tax=Paragonimus skrjabini miyazakii TaxID=59628 RepID=A0A8S9YLP5_9TREM|nr:hypothetical protein EG68_09097 [Paragonimus skrjabini miyazakii]